MKVVHPSKFLNFLLDFEVDEHTIEMASRGIITSNAKEILKEVCTN